MIGLGSTDGFDVAGGQLDLNTNVDFAYTVDRNAITTNTYLTAQSYEIDGTESSSVPEQGTWALMLAGLGAIWLGKRKRVSARWGILPVLALAVGLAQAGPLLPCTGFGPRRAPGAVELRRRQPGRDDRDHRVLYERSHVCQHTGDPDGQSISNHFDCGFERRDDCFSGDLAPPLATLRFKTQFTSRRFALPGWRRLSEAPINSTSTRSNRALLLRTHHPGP